MSESSPTVHEVFSRDHRSREKQLLLEREFFARVFLPNRTIKTTCANRLHDLNHCLNGPIRELRIPVLKIMDIAVSSGVSTVEWREHLRSQGVSCHITATDLTIEAVHSSLKFAPNNATLRDRSNRLMHFDICGRGCPPHQSGFHLHTIPQAVAESLIGCANLLGLVNHKKVSLLSRDFSSCEDITAVEDDLFLDNSKFRGRFDVVRVANLLNLAYFSIGELEQLIRNVVGRLAPRGLLAICRTHSDGNNHGSIFKLDKSGVIDRVGQGSEVEDMVLAAIAKKRSFAASLLDVDK